MRNKIIDENLNEEDCDHKEVHNFLKLLARNLLNYRENKDFQSIMEEDWTREVKREKKRSKSSIFSKRTYAVYKCTLEYERMTWILVAFYNILITISSSKIAQLSRNNIRKRKGADCQKVTQCKIN